MVFSKRLLGKKPELRSRAVHVKFSSSLLISRCVMRVWAGEGNLLFSLGSLCSVQGVIDGVADIYKEETVGVSPHSGEKTYVITGEAFFHNLETCLICGARIKCWMLVVDRCCKIVLSS